VDVVVLGGGMAGIGAACAASDLGMDTVLVERLGWLGGNGTSGGVRGFCGETRGQGRVFSDIIRGLQDFEAIEPYFPARTVFFKGRKYEHQYLVLVLDRLVKEHGFNLMLHSRVIDLIVERDHVIAAIIAGKDGLKAIRASFFIDCTGDADACRAAGCQVMKGRRSDGLQLPMSIIGFYRNAGLFNPRGRNLSTQVTGKKIREKSDKPMTSFSRSGRCSRGVKIKVPMHDSTTTDGITRAEMEGRQVLLRVLQYYQEREGKRWELDHLSPIIGIREGARIKGEYILTVDDCRRGRSFPDGIAVGHYPLDAHDPTDDKRTYILERSELRVPPYDIPLRSLIPAGMKNLMVAGRNLSADQLALSSARVMTTCCAMGQAAATAIHLCMEENIDPLALAVEGPNKLQQAVKQQGIHLEHDLYTPVERIE
ncbi:FAD-dependent oxidoreductase, partial [Candidatus Bathyarchaeota archaeon]|nr:FAD-dependent oxidoreductase [Candidatus Bathyarchaeota archaeon]